MELLGNHVGRHWININLIWDTTRPLLMQACLTEILADIRCWTDPFIRLRQITVIQHCYWWNVSENPAIQFEYYLYYQAVEGCKDFIVDIDKDYPFITWFHCKIDFYLELQYKTQYNYLMNGHQTQLMDLSVIMPIHDEPIHDFYALFSFVF